MNNAEIQYLERMYNRSIKALKSFMLEEANDEYLFSSRNRAEFNRLRLEITKELLRLENKSASLKELGEMMSKPLSKSGVNHKLKKLEEIASGIKGD